VYESGTGDFTEDPTRIRGQTLRQLRPVFPLERPTWLQIIGTIEYPAHHVPLGQPQGMVSNCIEHASVVLAQSPGPRRAGRSMAELGRSRRVSGPLLQLGSGCVAQGVMQPYRAQPAVPLRVRHAQLLGPGRGQLRYPLDVLQAFG